MKKILFPTDFSAASLNAFQYALRLASTLQAEIITLHVYELAGATYSDYYDYLTENYNISELGQFENFKSEVPKLRDIAHNAMLGHVKMSHMLETGNVVECILSVQISEGIDYIVMGTKGATGLKEIFLGSVTEEVMNRATSIVLAVPEKCKYRTIKNMLFMTEFDHFEFEGLKDLMDLAETFGAEIHALQVKPHHEEKDAGVLSEWMDRFSGMKVVFSILASNATEETVNDYIELENIDVVATAVRHKNIFERLFFFSLSRNLAYHSDIPTLSLPKAARLGRRANENKKRGHHQKPMGA